MGYWFLGRPDGGRSRVSPSQLSFTSAFSIKRRLKKGRQIQMKIKGAQIQARSDHHFMQK